MCPVRRWTTTSPAPARPRARVRFAPELESLPSSSGILAMIDQRPPKGNDTWIGGSHGRGIVLEAVDGSAR